MCTPSAVSVVTWSHNSIDDTKNNYHKVKHSFWLIITDAMTKVKISILVRYVWVLTKKCIFTL